MGILEDMANLQRQNATPKPLKLNGTPPSSNNAIPNPKVKIKGIAYKKSNMSPTMPTIKVKTPAIHLKAYSIVNEQLSRAGELAKLERAIIDLEAMGYNKTRINEVSKYARAYAKSSSKVTAKELLDFYAQVMTRPALQSEANTKLMRDIIYGLYKAIGLYEDIVRDEQDKG